MLKRNSVWANIDWITVLLYLLLVFLGWLNIYASVFNEERSSILDISQRYGKQMIWIGAALLIAFIILLIEANFYVLFAYFFYGFLVFLLVLVLAIGTEINGAKSWFVIGGFSIQPAEFAKFATALALARYMSSFGFKLQRFKSLVKVTAIILLPAFFILIQNDTGSALVYFAFILVLYREGLSGVVLFFGTFIAILFVLSLVLSKLFLFILIPSLALISFFIFNPRLKKFNYILLFFAAGFSLSFALKWFAGDKFSTVNALSIGSFLSAVASLFYGIGSKIKNYSIIALVFLSSLLFSISVDYAFNNILEPYHQDRINELLGIKSDPLGAGYNVNQSKIAIGSGGFSGKGFLKGTQTKFDFVPEQSTDFIFCTVGEEWGFIGTFIVVLLFLLLFVRLIILAERQRSRFSRIYGYSVAVILFFHFMVNIGMTIGMMPVIGIPLPFFSYGGSSLWSFTILLFIFVRLDARRWDRLSD